MQTKNKLLLEIAVKNKLKRTVCFEMRNKSYSNQKLYTKRSIIKTNKPRAIKDDENLKYR